MNIHTFVSFDIESLFTNVPLKKTIEIILGRVYSENKISPTLSKASRKKLLLDAFNKKLYEQTDGVSMGSPLDLLMANVVMTKHERVLVKDYSIRDILSFIFRIWMIR